MAASGGAALRPIKPISVITSTPAQRRPNPVVAPVSNKAEKQSTVRLPKAAKAKVYQPSQKALNAARNKAMNGAKNTKAKGTGVTPDNNPLTPLTQKQIIDEAKNIANQTYAGQYKSLSSQQSQAVGLDQKRASDQKYYD